MSPYNQRKTMKKIVRKFKIEKKTISTLPPTDQIRLSNLIELRELIRVNENWSVEERNFWIACSIDPRIEILLAK